MQFCIGINICYIVVYNSFLWFQCHQALPNKIFTGQNLCCRYVSFTCCSSVSVFMRLCLHTDRCIHTQRLPQQMNVLQSTPHRWDITIHHPVINKDTKKKRKAHQKLCCGLSVLSRRCRWGRMWPGMRGDCRRPGPSGSCGQNQYQRDWTGLYWAGEHRY